MNLKSISTKNRKNSIGYFAEPTGFSSGSYIVQKGGNDTQFVIPRKDKMQCTCSTYEQNKTTKYYTCKHGYSVLRELGYDSLAEYIQSK